MRRAGLIVVLLVGLPAAVFAIAVSTRPPAPASRPRAVLITIDPGVPVAVTTRIASCVDGSDSRTCTIRCRLRPNGAGYCTDASGRQIATFTRSRTTGTFGWTAYAGVPAPSP